MKLIIQIPCYNESETLEQTISSLPTSIAGIETIEILVIDDGSTDGTPNVAKSAGAHHVFVLPVHQGLAKAFSAGLKYSVKLGADIIVNTDADNQYKPEYIEKLIQPILNNTADMVIGCRPIQEISHFSTFKKYLQRLGSRTVRFLTGIEVPDATSGFRAYSRTAAKRLRIFSDFTYTVETLLQASRLNFHIVSIPVDINPPTRPSRLFGSNWSYIRKQMGTMFRIWSMYSPYKLFSRSGTVSLLLGLALFLRFLVYYFISWPEPSGKVQSLIIAAVFLIFGVFLILIGVIADLIAVNRRLMEDVLDSIDSDNEG
ncbi:glycosyltransferase family 2 protein [bacterium]|nr:glycosyltransferase family 2 protein [candidate division CSSED10-310 bacterium]